MLRAADALADFEFEAGNSASNDDADEPYRPPKPRHRRSGEGKQRAKGRSTYPSLQQPVAIATMRFWYRQ